MILRCCLKSCAERPPPAGFKLSHYRFTDRESGTRAETSKSMAHKFKIGQMVNYHPAARALRESSGAYSVTGFLPEKGGQPMYRIKHFSEDHHRVAQESELSAVQPGRSLRARCDPLSDRD